MAGRTLSAPEALRGQIWLADVGLSEPKRFVIVSNNARNRRLNEVLGARTTTAPKPALPSIVAFKAAEVAPEPTFVVADDIWPLDKRDLIKRTGALSISQMRRLEQAIKAALALDA
jgi:mRNA interferase MazF